MYVHIRVYIFYTVHSKKIQFYTITVATNKIYSTDISLTNQKDQKSHATVP
jgi:hypothetical protein